MEEATIREFELDISDIEETQPDTVSIQENVMANVTSGKYINWISFNQIKTKEEPEMDERNETSLEEQIEDTATETATATVEAPAETPVEAAEIEETSAEVSDSDTVEEQAEETEEGDTTEEAATATPEGDTPSLSLQNAYDYIRHHTEKLSNANVIDTAGFPDIPAGKQILFKTRSEDDAELIIYNQSNRVWVEEDQPVESIRAEHSGIVIESPTSRVYLGKTNTTKFDIEDNKVTKMTVFKKSKESDNVTANEQAVESREADLDTIKLTINSITPRLYERVKDMETKAEIRAAVDEYRTGIKDVAHLLKLDKLLYLGCQL